ncbi:hypothetical protein [Celeribacter sp.]|uniref:hypothetical protein n=1 Tax=Celeribacter sp. TaxID=1890673 RepID=UPI003A8EEAE9
MDEVNSHITSTGHINLISGVVISGDWFNFLREETLKAGDTGSYGTQDALGVTLLAAITVLVFIAGL